MKTLSYISLLMLLILNSCASTLYTGAEYDDLYYSPSDKPVVAKEYSGVNNQIAEKELKANDYYDNVYAADTLVTDKYSVPSDYDDQIVVNNSNMGGSGYDYYDDSYANRMNMFYGNYFNPYWQDPFYFNMGFNYGYPYFGFGMNFGYGFGIGFGYGYGYPYYGYPYYGYGYPYYDSYYGCCYPYYGYGYSDAYHTSYGRRERPSNSSSRYNESLGTGGARRSSDGTAGGYLSGGRRTGSVNQALTTDARRSAAGTTAAGATSKSNQEAAKNGQATPRSASSSQRTVINSRPDYKSSNRTYTPSYNNPRMSTRPSYNNSRVSDGSGANARQGGSTGTVKNFNSTAPVRNSPNRSFNQSSGSGQKSSSFSNMQRRYSTPSSSSRQYSVPSRQSSGSSSRSFSSGGSSHSSGSSSGSRSSYSSGSSGGGGGGRSSSSSSHSSGSRR